MKYVKQFIRGAKTYLTSLNRENWKVIALCILTAAIFWIFNSLNKPYTARIEYPIDIHFNQDSLVAVNKLPEEIGVNVTGLGWQLLRQSLSISSEPIRIPLENPIKSDFLVNSKLIPLVSEKLPEFTTNFIYNDTIFLQIEKKMMRKLPVRLLPAELDLRSNFILDSEIVIEPDSVEFSGPSSLINILPDTFLITLSENDLHDDYFEEISMDLFTPSLIRSNPDLIRVQFNITEIGTMNQEIVIEPVNFPYDSSVYLEQRSVQATMKVKRRSKIEFDQLDYIIVADLTNVDRADSTIALELISLPEYIYEIEIAPKRIKVVYE